MGTTRRIDVHHHILTPYYVEELAKVGVVQAGGHPFPQWKPEDSLAVMDRYEIETALLSVSAPGLCFGDATKARDMARSLNEFAANCVERSPRLIPIHLPQQCSLTTMLLHPLHPLHLLHLLLWASYHRAHEQLVKLCPCASSFVEICQSRMLNAAILSPVRVK